MLQEELHSQPASTQALGPTGLRVLSHDLVEWAGQVCPLSHDKPNAHYEHPTAKLANTLL